MRPTLAISAGDPAGIGPEIVAASLPVAVDCSHPIVFGHWPTFEAILPPGLPPVEQMDSPRKPTPGRVGFVHTGPGRSPIRANGDESAAVQFQSLSASVDALLDGTCDAIATAPVSKVAVAKVSPGFTGHTEYLADRCRLGHDDVTMIFASDQLTVGLVATHLPLKDIPDTITRERYARTLAHIVRTVRGLRPGKTPRVAVAALNPHGGEDGLLGREELDIIGPFCQGSRQLCDAEIHGPFPADVVFRDAFAGKYDAVVAAYHDQAMIPLKLNGVGATVNITMGLPFIRTSPDHGVAYDLAGTGTANPDGMKKAIGMASLLWQNTGTVPR